MSHFGRRFPITYGENHYEHIVFCVDNLLVASNDPKSTPDVLTNERSFKLKGTGPISYRLSCAFGRYDDGTLHFSPKSVWRPWLIATQNVWY